jgi:hypothetical protein
MNLLGGEDEAFQAFNTIRHRAIQLLAAVVMDMRKAREGKVMDTDKEDEKAKRLGLAVACRGGRYFVVVASTGLEHCGPYSSFFDAWDWIQQIQEEGK